VAKHLIKELKKLESFKRKDYRLSLQECFMKLDQCMLTKEGKKELSKLATAGRISAQDGDADMYGDVMHAGCTANVVMITKAEILCANAGDSRAVLSKKGKSKDLSVDHKPDNPTEKRRIERANGFVEDNRVNGMLALSRSIGDFEYKTNIIMKPEDQVITAFPEISIEKITNDCDFIICACDGIWDCLTS
jgi:serine/threonine protein phosphatase PrpC